MIKQIQIIVYTYVHSHQVNMINKQYGQVSDRIASRCLITFGSVEDIILTKLTKSFSRINDMYCSLISECDGQQNTKWNSSSIINSPSLTHNGQTRSAISKKIPVCLPVSITSEILEHLNLLNISLCFFIFKISRYDSRTNFVLKIIM